MLITNNVVSSYIPDAHKQFGSKMRRKGREEMGIIFQNNELTTFLRRQRSWKRLDEIHRTNYANWTERDEAVNRHKHTKQKF